MMRTLMAGALGMGLVTTAAAQEPVFPPGSTFGLVPFEGAEIAREFTGFINRDTIASVLIVEMPVEAFDQVSTQLQDPAALRTQNIEASDVETTAMAGMDALRVRGVQTVQGITVAKCIVLLRGEHATGVMTAQVPGDGSEDACAFITGIAERPTPSLEDKMAALPFALGDMAQMRLVNVMAGSAAIFTVGPGNSTAEAPQQPLLIVAHSLGPNAIGTGQRLALSERTLRSAPQYREAEVVSTSEDVQIAGAPATEIVFTAARADGTPVTGVQWIRFEDRETVRMIGEAPTAQWDEALARFQTVRDGLTVE